MGSVVAVLWSTSRTLSRHTRIIWTYSPREQRDTESKTLPSALLEPFGRNINTLVMTRDPANRTINWLYVQRHVHELRYLASGRLSSKGSLQKHIKDILDVFVDFDAEDRSQELHRCSRQFIPAGATSNSLPFRAMYAITRKICLELKSSLDDKEAVTITTRIKNLIGYLSWSIWKECRGCGDHEFCAVAIWPHGLVDDHEHPVYRDLDDGGKRWTELLGCCLAMRM
ncbi:hypothetical protein MPH_03330 [Macrophomina phaseolina MS6]|uniref:Uncharacterized protein n=1 Tax=Macrophomina phaseolina (strain MS6) TaxID=1126212 RepID=K2RAH3_MACPH|nr:hypothetical protein MPH_03330 [Macrophomina phaseolina MS6]